MAANYEYIISSLPHVSPEWKYAEGFSFNTYVEWITTQLDDKDRKTLNTLLDGFKAENMVKEFYEAALTDKNRFIREYFALDLNVRNAKARFLNKAFDRPLNQDVIDLETPEFNEASKVEDVLALNDLLERERGLDDLMWDRISEIVIFNYFDMDAILAFVSRLHIVDRWLSLDEKTGREMFNRLVDEVLGTFKGVNYTAPTE